MTLLEWFGTGVLDFLMSLGAVVVALHFDLEGRWQARHDERARAKEEKDHLQAIDDAWEV